MEDPYPTGTYPGLKVWVCALFSCLNEHKHFGPVVLGRTPGKLSLGRTHFVPRDKPSFFSFFHSGSPLSPRDKPILSLGQTGDEGRQNFFLYVLEVHGLFSLAKVAIPRSWYRAQKPLRPRNTKKIRKSHEIPHPGSGPENTKKIQKKYENGHFRAIFVFFLYFFRIFRARPGVGDFVTFSYFFSYFQT